MTIQALLIMAAFVATVTGMAHSFLGERLIFRYLRQSTLVPSLPAPPLLGRHVRILWATWHLASVLGWAFAGLLWQLAQDPGGVVSADSVLLASAAGFVTGSCLVLVGTAGRHPGWVALGAVGVLSWAALGAS